MGVRMNTGCTQLTLMLCGANSRAADFVRPRTAHLEATYGCASGAPRRPSIEEMLMIEPLPADVIGSTTARIPKNVPVRLTSMTWCHLLRSKVPRRPTSAGACVVDQDVELAESRQRRFYRGRPIGGLGHVKVPKLRAVGKNARQREALLIEDVADDDPCPLGGEQLGVRSAHALCTTGNERDLALYPSHRCVLSASSSATCVDESLLNR